MEEYSKVWSYLEGIARNQLDAGAFTPETTKTIAQKIKAWRYSKGGLLAEETTRDAAFALQRALWNYDETEEAYKSIRRARSILRAALRADTGLSEDIEGQTIFDATEKRQKIREELKALQSKLGIVSNAEAGQEL